MTITIGTSFTTTRLQAQPFGYDESDTRKGLTAQKWRISGLLTPAEWQDLLAEYDAWRDLRITDQDTLVSGVVGTTVDFSGNANGISWSSIPCWFISAPSGEQLGAYISASVELVDAAQALEVLLRQEEKNKQNSNLPDLGTVTLGSATLTLTKPMETYQDTPQLQLTASGTHYLSGPLMATRLRNIEGTTDATGWGNVQSWYETSVAAVPTAGDWFPISAPSATAEVVVEAGVKATRYTVTVTAAEVK